MGERTLWIDGVRVAATDAGSLDVPGVDEVFQDRVGCALGDANAVGDLADARVGVLRDGHEHVSVVCQQTKPWSGEIETLYGIHLSGRRPNPTLGRPTTSIELLRQVSANLRLRFSQTSASEVSMIGVVGAAAPREVA